MRPIVGYISLALVGVLLVVGTGCSDDGVAPGDDDPTALLAVVPQGGSVAVSVETSVVVTFDHAMGFGMEAFAVLHEGSFVGPEIEGGWTLSEDRMILTFRPAQPLRPATRYVIHLGGGMRDEHGNFVNLDTHGPTMGGQWATASMMTGGMGMDGLNSQMMGPGWAHPSNGTYGMTFSFTTAG